MNNQLYKSRSNKRIIGVCGGLGEYFAIDPTIIRIVVVILAFIGIGLLGYLIAAIIIPEDRRLPGIDILPKEIEGLNIENSKNTNNDPRRSTIILGSILILFGAIALLHHYVDWIDYYALGASGIIALGVIIILSAPKRKKDN